MVKQNLKSSKAKVFSDSSRRTGAVHWFKQRLTAILMLFLVLWVICVIVITKDYDVSQKIQWFKNPLNAIFLAIFILVSYFHAFLGLQVVIEDYVHKNFPKFFLIISIKLVFFILSVATVFAILHLNLN
jgi:succinate dehydrogenase / fumarate reductase membrane anchor subunit